MWKDVPLKAGMPELPKGRGKLGLFEAFLFQLFIHIITWDQAEQQVSRSHSATEWMFSVPINLVSGAPRCFLGFLTVLVVICTCGHFLQMAKTWDLLLWASVSPTVEERALRGSSSSEILLIQKLPEIFLSHQEIVDGYQLVKEKNKQMSSFSHYYP